MALERAEYRRNGALIIPQREQFLRPRPALRLDIQRTKGVDLVTDLEQNGYRYEDAVFKLRSEIPGRFRIGPKLSDWLFSSGDIRKDMNGMKGKSNPDEWEIDVSDPNHWWVVGIGEYKWQDGDIEKPGREKRNMFKNLIDKLEDTKLLPFILKRGLPELNIPDRIGIKRFDELDLTFISPSEQTAEFFRRRNIQHIPIPRNVVEIAA